MRFKSQICNMIKKPQIAYTQPTETLKTEVETIPAVASQVSLNDLKGQYSVKQLLQNKVDAYRLTGNFFGHWLFEGYSGLGKTTFVRAFAHDLGCNVHEIIANRVNSWQDITAILHNAKDGDIIFFDEAHALKPMFQNNLYDIMEEGSYTETSASGVTRIDVPDVAIFAATTHGGLLNDALRNRFKGHVVISAYSDQDIAEMVVDKCYTDYKLIVSQDIALIVAKISQGIPRQAMKMCSHLYDTASICEVDQLTHEMVYETLKLLNIDPYLGTDLSMRRYLVALYKHPKGLGAKSLSLHINEDESTLDRIERFLFSHVQCDDLDIDGPLVSVGRGRVLTQNGVKFIHALQQLKKDEWFVAEAL